MGGQYFCILVLTSPRTEQALKETLSIKDGLAIQSLGVASSEYWRLDLLPLVVRNAHTDPENRRLHENEEVFIDSVRAVHENPDIQDADQLAKEMDQLAQILTET